MIFIVRPSVVSDIYALAANLRADDALEVTCLDLDPKAAIRHSYRNAVLRRTLVVNGMVAAMWGVCGDMVSDIGEPWLMTGPAVETVKLSFVKQAHRELADMLALRDTLIGHVAARYARAVRLLEWFGFTVGYPFPFGQNEAPFRRFEIAR